MKISQRVNRELLWVAMKQAELNLFQNQSLSSKTRELLTPNFHCNHTFSSNAKITSRICSHCNLTDQYNNNCTMTKELIGI